VPEKIDAAAAVDESVMAFSGAAPFAPGDANDVVSRVGSVSPAHVEYSAGLLESIPVEVRKELADPLGASSVICALLLDADVNQKGRQIEYLKNSAPAEIIRHVQIMADAVSGIDPKIKLPLVDLAMPSLRRMSPAQYEEFKRNVRILMEADEQLSLFEFAVGRIITHRLDAAFANAAKKQTFKTIEPLVDDALILISKLARVGHADKEAAGKAFASAAQKISAYGSVPAALSEDPPFEAVGRAISRIAAAKPGIKEIVLEACARCVLFDRTVSGEEAELLRAIAYCLDLPLAPFLGSAV
jgi:hypothetical protein